MKFNPLGFGSLVANEQFGTTMFIQVCYWICVCTNGFYTDLLSAYWP